MTGLAGGRHEEPDGRQASRGGGGALSDAGPSPPCTVDRPRGRLRVRASTRSLAHLTAARRRPSLPPAVTPGDQMTAIGTIGCNLAPGGRNVTSGFPQGSPCAPIATVIVKGDADYFQGATSKEAGNPRSRWSPASVGEEGFEPSHPLGHTDLNRARLPFRHSPFKRHVRLARLRDLSDHG
jgi:hypothetical protein